MKRRDFAAGFAATTGLALRGRSARAAGKPMRIGVLGDLSGPYADSGGPGSVLAARLAVQDFGGQVLGREVEVLAGDTQNKPDIAAGIARDWFDTQDVSAITDLPVTPVGMAVQEVARQKTRTVLIAGASASDITSRLCTPISTHWADDSHALAVGSVDTLANLGKKNWYFLIPDYGFGQAVLRDATEALTARGATVAGSIKHPLGTSDYSSYLLSAQSSGAQVVATAAASGDLVNTIKQASEFGLTANGKQILAAFLVYITDIDSIGLHVAKGLVFPSSFYWDQNDVSRAFSRRFFAERKRMPTQDHAAIYTAVTRFLAGVTEAGTDDALAIGRAMRARPFDYFGRQAHTRSDGRVMYDLSVYRVKSPEESRYAWDYLSEVGSVKADTAFLPINRSCA